LQLGVCAAPSPANSPVLAALSPTQRALELDDLPGLQQQLPGWTGSASGAFSVCCVLCAVLCAVLCVCVCGGGGGVGVCVCVRVYVLRVVCVVCESERRI
jgi:hypothetical protein